MRDPARWGGSGPIRAGVGRVFRLAAGRRGRVGEEVDEEIALHLELRAELLVRRGMSPEEARAEALRRFGAMDTSRRALRRTAARREQRMRTREWFESVWYDLRQAARSLMRERGFTAVVVLTLALGIGANASMFGVIDRLLLSGPAHVRDAGELRRLYMTRVNVDGRENSHGIFGYVTMAALGQGVPSLSGVAAHTGVLETTLGRGESAELVGVSYVSASFFPLLGVQPVLGRFLSDHDQRPPAGELVAVIDHGLWQRRFGGDPGVIGRPVVLGDRTFTVVGVAPPGFTGVESRHTAAWLPVSASTEMPDWPTTQDMTWLRIVGRLAPGASAELADAQVDAVYQATRAPRTRGDEVRLSLRPLWYDMSGVEAPEVAVSRWLVGVSAVLLLVACGNVANLLLARGVRRRREVAVRLALGVPRGRLVRLLMAEGALLALAGGAAGLLVAQLGGQLLRATLLADVSWSRPPVDGRVLLYTLAATSVTALLIGMLPALRCSDLRLAATLKDGTPQAGGRSALSGGLTVLQATLSVLLLVGAGLFLHSLWKVRHLDLGFESEHLVTAQAEWPRMGDVSREESVAERERRNVVMAEVLYRLRQLPGVTAAAIGEGTPMQGSYSVPLKVPGLDSLPTLAGGGPYVTWVTDQYFAAFGQPVVRGRAIEARDMASGAQPVAVVNETMARTLWPSGDAIGQCLIPGAGAVACHEVVGITRDAIRFQLREDPSMQYYIPQVRTRDASVVAIRHTGDASTLVPMIRREFLAADPSLIHVRAVTMSGKLAPQLRPWRLGAMVFALLGVLALLVAAVGLYSVMSYTAASRAREMGVRLALGARPADVRMLVLRQGVTLGSAGVGAGLILSLVGGRWAEPILFGTSPREPLVLGTVVATLLTVTVLASVAPAWRASRVSPSAVLRE